jgi:hypothetical protein
MEQKNVEGRELLYSLQFWFRDPHIIFYCDAGVPVNHVNMSGIVHA